MVTIHTTGVWCGVDGDLLPPPASKECTCPALPSFLVFFVLFTLTHRYKHAPGQTMNVSKLKGKLPLTPFFLAIFLLDINVS